MLKVIPTYFAWHAILFIGVAEAMSSSEDESVKIQTNRWKIDSINYDVAKSTQMTYCNTGYGVSSPRVQNQKDVCLEIKMTKGNY